MVRGKYIQGDGDLSQVAALRKEIFGQELQVEAFSKLEDGDVYAVHGVAFYEEQVVAVGRITYDGDKFEISHVAVKKEHRHIQYGDFMLKMLINKAVLAGAQNIYAYTLPGTEGFFETVGFVKEKETQLFCGVECSVMSIPSNKLHCCSGCQS